MSDNTLVERMENLVRFMAKCAPEEISSMGTGCQTAYRLATGIAASLPKPVDPEKRAVRAILSEHEYLSSYTDDDAEWEIEGAPRALALTAFRAGRAFERENG